MVAHTYPRVKLLVGYLAWRYRSADHMSGAGTRQGAIGPACRFLAPDEPLRLVGPGLVMASDRRVYRCPEGFLEERLS